MTRALQLLAALSLLLPACDGEGSGETAEPTEAEVACMDIWACVEECAPLHPVYGYGGTEQCHDMAQQSTEDYDACHGACSEPAMTCGEQRIAAIATWETAFDGYDQCGNETYRDLELLLDDCVNYVTPIGDCN